MNEREIKPSFSLKYLLLTAITTAIIGLVGFGISKIYDSRPIKEISVANGYSINLINDRSLPEEKFEVEYYLKGEPRTKISSLFRKKVIIKNTGNLGVVDLDVTAIIRNSELKLVDPPRVKTIPKEIIDTISVKKSGENAANKHSWVVSLLNPGESITFEYSVFSEKKIKSMSLDIIPRKKDWVVQYENLEFSKKSSVSGLIGALGALMSVISLILYLLGRSWLRPVGLRKIKKPESDLES